LLVAKAIGGVGAGLGFLAGIRYIQRRYGEGRPHFGQGLYGAGYPLGSAIGLWGMPSLALLWGWRGAFWATTAVIALVLVVWSAASNVERMRRPGTMLDAGRCANCWATTVQHAAGFGLVFAAATWVTTFLLREFALPLEASGLLGSILLVLAVIARPVGGYLIAREHVGTLAVMRGAQLLVLAGVALVALPGRPLLAALAGAAALGVGGGIPYSAVFNTAAASLRSAPSAAQSLTALGGLMGTLIGAPAMGYAIQTWGFSWAWLILGAISAAALLVTFVMRGEEDFAA
jgi:NNP family nitrate/nitrite transporter-like MFS transporter